MNKFIAGFFKVIGIFFIIISFFTLSVNESDLAFATFCIILFIGTFFFFLGKSMNKIARIEDRLGKYILLPIEQQKPLKTCERCGKIYEVQSGLCPYCELEQMKKAFKTHNY